MSEGENTTVKTCPYVRALTSAIGFRNRVATHIWPCPSSVLMIARIYIAYVYPLFLINNWFVSACGLKGVGLGADWLR